MRTSIPLCGAVAEAIGLAGSLALHSFLK